MVEISLDWTTLLLQLFNFLLLVFILTKLLYKPIFNVLQKRQDYIKESLLNADRDKEDARKLLDDYKAQLAEARKEAQRIIQEAQKQSEELKRDIETAAQERAKVIVENAQREIEREKEKALIELRQEIVDISLDAASAIIKKELNPQTHNNLVDEFIKKAGGVS